MYKWLTVGLVVTGCHEPSGSLPDAGDVGIDGPVEPDGPAADAPSDGATANEVVWNLVDDFGMIAENAKPAVDAAVAAAVERVAADPAVTVVLYAPAGAWVFQHSLGPAISITGSAVGRITLRGAGPGPDGTAFVFAAPDQYGILVESTNGLTVEQLHLTRPGLYTTQGVVTATPPMRIRFRVQDGFPDPLPLVNAEGALGNDRTLIAFEGDPGDPRLAPTSESLKMCPGTGKTACAVAMERVAPGEYEAILDDPLTTVQAAALVGQRVALKAKSGEQTLRAVDADDLTVRDVRFTRHAAVSLAVKGASDRTVIERVRVERAPAINGHVPFFSGPGGGPQVEADVDGPIIRDCFIEGTTDDAIAVFSHRPAAPMRGARIERNVIRDGQGRGINITQSQDGMCVDNEITRCQNPSIQLKSNQTANGAPGVVNWTIARNHLIEPWTDPAIALMLENRETSGRHTGIVIEDNIITRAARANPIVYAEHTDTLEIRDNVVESFSDRCDVRGKGLADVVAAMPLVYVAEATSVTGTGNLTQELTARPAFVERLNNAGEVDVTWVGTSASVPLLPPCP